MYLMNNFLASIFFIITLCVQQAHADETNEFMAQPLSVEDLKTRIIAPRIFTVSAYVIEKYDKCPPCPANAVCETCVFGIYVADNNRLQVTDVSRKDGIYLQTNDAYKFKIGMKYLFHIRYRMEKNAYGRWQQTGPELIDYIHTDSSEKRE
jgi:hypothetical protein